MIRKSVMVGLVSVLGIVLGLIAPQQANADGSHVYTQPGQHHVNDRYWYTDCEMYSSNVVRCTTDIWATKPVLVNGRYQSQNGWVFNNLTYLPSARATWEGNPLAETTEWTSDGRTWRTECNTETTGGNGCRSYIWTTLVQYVDGRFVTNTDWIFNNIVHFSAFPGDAISSIPARSADVPGFPSREPDQSSGITGTCGVSFYSDYFDGRRTANGEIFRQNQLTAAHKTLPFNTRVRVTNRANGQSVTVRINDRGPFISGRCLDLSRSAMEAIGGIRAGVITGDYEILNG